MAIRTDEASEEALDRRVTRGRQAGAKGAGFLVKAFGAKSGKAKKKRERRKDALQELLVGEKVGLSPAQLETTISKRISKRSKALKEPTIFEKLIGKFK